MKRTWLAIGIILLFVGTCIIPAIAQDTEKPLPTSRGNTIYVDDDNMEGPWDGTSEHPYQFINDGVNAADISDTVYVLKGLYQEGYIHIEKTIHLIGENRNQTIIDGGGHSWIFIINADYVLVQGFTLQNCDTFDYPYDAAIWIRTGSFVTIAGNRFIDNDYASYVYSNHNKFSNNIFLGNQHGIWLKNDVGFNIIYHNHFEGNNPQHWSDKYDLYIQGPLSPFNIIMKNNFIDNSPHVYFMCGRFTQWIRNYWSDNTGGPHRIYGIIGFLPKGIGPGSDVITIHGYQVDWFPAQEPYDIPGMR